jgi:hypothetical protein
MPKDRALVGAAGVHYLAFQLSARGYAVGLTAPGVKYVDLLATNTSTGKSVALQVKTMTKARVSSKKYGDYWKWWLKEDAMASAKGVDFLFAFVDFKGELADQQSDATELPDVFLIPAKRVRSARMPDSASGWFCLAHNTAMKYLNGWDQVDALLS